MGGARLSRSATPLLRSAVSHREHRLASPSRLRGAGEVLPTAATAPTDRSRGGRWARRRRGAGFRLHWSRRPRGACFAPIGAGLFCPGAPLRGGSPLAVRIGALAHRAPFAVRPRACLPCLRQRIGPWNRRLWGLDREMPGGEPRVEQASGAYRFCVTPQGYSESTGPGGHGLRCGTETARIVASAPRQRWAASSAQRAPAMRRIE